MRARSKEVFDGLGPDRLAATAVACAPCPQQAIGDRRRPCKRMIPAGLVLLDEPVTPLGVVQPDDVLETVGRLVVAINVHQDGR
jgi:hypothetical protein